jgi:hypothetical protein
VPVYYHETIDPTSVREKEVEYLDTLGEVVTKIVNTPGSDMRCVANWVVVWATGRWPQIIGQWEMSSWDWFTTHFANFKLEVDHPKGYEEYRHGGFDRLLVPYDGTPTLDEIVNDGIRAPWILQETVQVAPLQSHGYLAAVSEAGEKLRAAERGIRLHGAYNVMLRNDSEVVVQWAFDELPTWVETVEQPDAVPELRAWRERAAGLERSHAGVLLRPTEWSPLH